MIDSKERRARVFLSYSRKDGAFADRLRDSLIAKQFEAYLDTHDIAPGEPWRERLSGLISTADTVVFCLSPDFIASPICDWEVNEAERLGKRLLPVVVTETPDTDVPQRLKRLNYVHMRDQAEMAEGLDKLASVLNTDIAWIREHTRLGERAREWRARGLSEGSLLRGEQIAAAEAWLTQRPREAAEITDDIASFIAASRKSETARARRARRRGRITTGASLTASALVSFLGWQMYGQWQAAESRQSLNLANLANQHIAKGNAVISTLLALEALPDATSTELRDRLRPLVPEARAALHRAVHSGAGKWSLSSHIKKVTAARISPDLAFVATASADSTVRIWNVLTGRQYAVLVGHLGRIDAIEFSPDGRLLATGATDRTVRLWDWRNGRLQSTMVGHLAPVQQVSFDTVGKSLLSVAGDGEVRVWAVATGSLIVAPTDTSVTGSRVRFDRIHFTPEGALLTLGGALEKVARIWDLASGANRVIFKRAHDGNQRIDISPDGRRAAVIGQRRVALIDVASGAEIRRLDAPEGAKFWRSQFSGDGTKIAVHVDFGNATDRRFRFDIIDARLGVVLCSTPMQERIAPRFEFDTKGRRLFAYMGLLVGTTFHPDAAWDGSTCVPSAQLASHRQQGSDAVGRDYRVSPDGDRVVSWSDDSVEIWDVSTGRQIAGHRVRGQERGWESFVLHPSGHVVVGFDGANLDAFDTRTGRHLARLDGHDDKVSAPLFSHDGSRLVANTRRAVILWETRSWTRVASPITDPRTVYSVTLSHDGRYALVQYEAAPADDTAEKDLLGTRVALLGRVIALESGAEVPLRAGAEVRHWAGLSSPDGQHDYRAKPGNRAEIYNVASGQSVATLSEHMGMAQVSANRRRLVTAGTAAAWVWEFPTGRLVSKLVGNLSGFGLNLSISPDGRRILTAPDIASPGTAGSTLGPDGRPIAAGVDQAKALWLWDADTGSLIAPLEGHTGTIEFQAMSPDSQRLITLANDNTARVWSLETGRMEAVLDLDGSGLTLPIGVGAAFGPDGHYVLTWTQSEALIWSLPASIRAHTRLARSNVPRCLTADERRAYFLSPITPRWCYEFNRWPYHDNAKTPPRPYSISERLVQGWDWMGGDAVLAALSRTKNLLREKVRSLRSNVP